MKNLFLPLAVFCLFAGGTAHSKSAPAPTMDLIQTGGGAQSSRVYHVFGGQTLTVDALIKGAPGTVVEVQADLLQKAQSLAVPVQKEIPVGKGLELADAAPHLYPLLLPIPEVKREALFLIQFRIKPKETGDWQAAGQAVVIAHPPGEVTESLLQLAREHRLLLFGTDKRLRDFLESRQIPHTDTGAELEDIPRGSEPRTVYLGSASAAQVARWANGSSGWRGSLIVFTADSALLPGVFVTPQNERKMLKVTLPLLDTLSTDPRSQKTLVEILKTAIAQ